MFALSKPDLAEILARAEAYRRDPNLPFTYPGVGSSRAGEAPSGFAIDHNRVGLGTGERTFLAGVEAVKRLVMFPCGWIQTYPERVACVPGEIVAILARGLGVWSLNFSRIVYSVDERDADQWRFGFAYGTLPDHLEAGEERFLIEWDRGLDVVSYDLLAFSRPRHPLARIANLYVRSQQRRFQVDSLAAMQQACADA